MNYILGYLFIGLLVTMLFEYIFEVIDKENEEKKFDSYWERLLFTIIWPLIIYLFIEGLIQK
jgi:hypothetical protein